MIKLTITYKDYVNCSVQGLTDTDRNLCYNKFRVFIPTARYTPQYKLGRWDGYINYFSLTGQTYINLLPEIYEMIDLDKYDIEIIKAEGLKEDPDLEEDIDETFMSNIKWYHGHRLENQPINLEEHQVRIINACIENHRCLVDAATSAGKTLIAGALAKKVLSHGRVVIIVPAKDLCAQTAEELKQFGLDVGIVGMGIREFGHDVTVCMWQTINSLERSKKENPLSIDELNSLTDDVVALIFDECHSCKSFHIKEVCATTFKNVPIRWGLTGTIPKRKDEFFCLLTSLGNVAVSVHTKELQDKGFVANCDIKCIRLEDNTKCFDFASELDYLTSDNDRLSFVATLLSSIAKEKGNVLTLVPRIKMGEILEEKMEALGTNVVFLDGSVKSKKRFEHYKSIATTDNKCIIATAQIASTGLNIPRLFNMALVDIGKSFTRVIQSIGRSIRLAKDKNYAEIFDISSTTKYSKKHFNERVKFYEERQHQFIILNIDKWK